MGVGVSRGAAVEVGVERTTVPVDGCEGVDPVGVACGATQPAINTIRMMKMMRIIFFMRALDGLDFVRQYADHRHL